MLVAMLTRLFSDVDNSKYRSKNKSKPKFRPKYIAKVLRVSYFEDGVYRIEYKANKEWSACSLEIREMDMDLKPMSLQKDTLYIFTDMK